MGKQPRQRNMMPPLISRPRIKGEKSFSHQKEGNDYVRHKEKKRTPPQKENRIEYREKEGKNDTSPGEEELVDAKAKKKSTRFCSFREEIWASSCDAITEKKNPRTKRSGIDHLEWPLERREKEKNFNISLRPKKKGTPPVGLGKKAKFRKGGEKRVCLKKKHFVLLQKK